MCVRLCSGYHITEWDRCVWIECVLSRALWDSDLWMRKRNSGGDFAVKAKSAMQHTTHTHTHTHTHKAQLSARHSQPSAWFLSAQTRTHPNVTAANFFVKEILFEHLNGSQTMLFWLFTNMQSFLSHCNTELTLNASLTSSALFFARPCLFVVCSLADVVDGMSVEGEDEESRSAIEAVASRAEDVTHTNPEEELSSSCLMEDDFTNSANDLAALGKPNTACPLCVCECVFRNTTCLSLCV